MRLDDKNVSLIFGVSGISGWSLARECLSYPSKDTFSRVLGLSARPLPRQTAYLPDNSRLEIYTGLDLTSKEQTLQTLESIPAIHDVTHVYFVAYTGHGSNIQEVVRVNGAILENALVAVKKLCTNLKFFTLQTGGKGYGTVGAGWPPAPWKEDLPRMPEPYASDIFYYFQYDILVKHAQNTSWHWSEIRPSFIPGFTPHHNAMNVAQGLGLFLSFYRSKKGLGADCIFPGTPESWTALHTDSFQDLVAHFHIHASLQPEKTHGRSFNVGDGQSVSWEVKWPIVSNYFGLKGIGPTMRPEEELRGIDWLMAQKDFWPGWVEENGLRRNTLVDTQWDSLALTLSFPIRIDYDLGASRSIGFQETLEPGQGYLLAFDRLRKAKFLP